MAIVWHHVWAPKCQRTCGAQVCLSNTRLIAIQHVQAAIVAEVTPVQHENAAVASGNLDLTAVDVDFSGKRVVRTNEN